MKNSNILSVSALIMGLVLLGAGCAKNNPAVDAHTAASPVVNTPAENTSQDNTLPSSEPVTPAQGDEPATKPVTTVPPKTEPTPKPPTPQPEPTPAPAPTPAPEPAKRVSVAIAGFAFQPSSISINKGDTVVWTNNDSAPHTVTASDGSFDSGALASGASFSHTFSSAGTVGYVCSVHSSMRAAIIVK